jgi:putative transposase
MNFSITAGNVLAALLGKDAPGLLRSPVSKTVGFDESDAWQKRDLSAKRYVDVWADASICKPGLKTGSSAVRC